jgi:hypothetical protein
MSASNIFAARKAARDRAMGVPGHRGGHGQPYAPGRRRESAAEIYARREMEARTHRDHPLQASTLIDADDPASGGGEAA